jgi:hypothetical protein
VTFDTLWVVSHLGGLLFLGYMPIRPDVASTYQAVTTDASLIKPRADILARVLPFTFFTIDSSHR